MFSLQEMEQGCTNATLVIDLFSDGKLASTREPVKIDFYQRPGDLVPSVDLVEALRRHQKVIKSNASTQIFFSSTKPKSPIFWPPVRIVANQTMECSRIQRLLREKTYIAVNLFMPDSTPTGDTDTLTIDLFRDGKLVKKAYSLPIRYIRDPDVSSGPSLSVDLYSAVLGRNLLPGEVASYVVLDERPLEPIDWRMRAIRPSAKMSYFGIQQDKGKYVAINIYDNRKGLKCVMCPNVSIFANEALTASFCSEACIEEFTQTQ